MSTTKLQTIDEIMEGKAPGSVKIRNPEWPPDALFIPYYRIASENRWYGVDNVGVSCGFRGDTPGYEVVRPKTAYYQWLMRSREGERYRTSLAMFASEDEAVKCINNEYWEAVCRLDYSRTDTEEETKCPSNPGV